MQKKVSSPTWLSGSALNWLSARFPRPAGAGAAAGAGGVIRYRAELDQAKLGLPDTVIIEVMTEKHDQDQPHPLRGSHRQHA